MNNINDVNQEIKLINRKTLNITGVNKIDSLTEQEFLINTNQGIIQVMGSNLVMQELNVEKGQITINGVVNKICFLDKQKEKSTILSKLFK